MPARIEDLQTPALLVDAGDFRENIATMSAALPADRLRPHVKAHKCTELARRQAEAGHSNFCCATIKEMEGMAAAGLGADLLLANEVPDAGRLTPLTKSSRITVAIDSPETLEAAKAAGIPEVLIDVNVGLPRCGCDPAEAGRLADSARKAGLEVRGVMGYEGHAVGLADRVERTRQVEEAMAILAKAQQEVGGEIVSAGGTGSYDINTVATEIQAGSYALMDTAYATLGLPFANALTLIATVISVNKAGWAVADCGLKALGMDHGNPSMLDGGLVWFCSDEHVTFSPPEGQSLPRVGDKVRVVPAHVDPTVAYHERLNVFDASSHKVLETWPVDLRGW
ncbi:MAG TPA: alanine racemase [Acidimicrobiales bacterium]|nr:alanine racemase [Acidimicrobiales bacterium]